MYLHYEHRPSEWALYIDTADTHVLNCLQRDIGLVLNK
jgi:hypothetical protein